MRPLTDCRPTALKLDDSFRGSVPGKCSWKIKLERKNCRLIEARSSWLFVTAANRSEKKQTSHSEPLFSLSLLLSCSVSNSPHWAVVRTESAPIPPSVQPMTSALFAALLIDDWTQQLPIRSITHSGADRTKEHGSLTDGKHRSNNGRQTALQKLLLIFLFFLYNFLCL